MIRGVKFASIPVTDQDRALAFYTEKLGFRLATDQPFSDEQRWIELGILGADTRVVLFRFDENLKPGGNMNVTFWADDVEATARELKSNGVGVCDGAQTRRVGYGFGIQGCRWQLLCSQLQMICSRQSSEEQGVLLRAAEC